jgi:hypothetical protein
MRNCAAVAGLLIAMGCASAPPDGEKAPNAGSGGKVTIPELVGHTMDTVCEQLKDVGLRECEDSDRR